MKKVLLVAIMAVFSFGANAQIKTPQPSPLAKVEQKVGLTDMTVVYSRPNMRERAIFGNLVPYDTMWRAGANSNTTIEFSTPVTIGEKEVKAGEYAIFVKPSAKSWEIYFYNDTNNWGTPKEWDATKVAATVKVETLAIPMKIETFTITFDDLTHESANLGLMWENVYVGVPIKTPTNKTILESITKTMNGPGAMDYYNAAVYLFSTEQDLEKSNEYMTKAMAMTEKPRFWQLRKQSLILAKVGDKKGAIAAAEKSLEGAKVAKNADYIKMNTDSLKEWGAK